jgi:cytidyltransferase-like protein
MIRVYSKGVFDLVHYGHVRFLQRARSLGDWLTVGVSPDERAASLKREPLLDVTQRAEVISAIRWVDEVITDGPLEITREFMRAHDLHIYAFGTANSQERAQRLADCRDLPRSMIVEIPYTAGVSTTFLHEALGRHLKNFP